MILDFMKSWCPIENTHDYLKIPSKYPPLLLHVCKRPDFPQDLTPSSLCVCMVGAHRCVWQPGSSRNLEAQTAPVAFL